MKRKDLKAGQVFRFYVGDGVYAFARAVFETEKIFFLVEVFDWRSRDGIFSEAILQMPRLIPIQNLGKSIIFDGHYDWELVHSCDDFNINENEISSLKFYFNHSTRIPNVKWKMENGQWNGEVMFFNEEINDIALSQELKVQLPDGTMPWNHEQIYRLVRKAWALEPSEWGCDREMFEWMVKERVYIES